MNDKREILVQKIEAAFQNTPYPKDGYIGSELQDDFKNKRWQEVVNDFPLMMRWRDELSFFSIDGLRYFLPALLIAIIRTPVQVDTLVDNILGVFAMPEIDRVYEGNLRFQAKKNGVSDDTIEEKILAHRNRDLMIFEAQVASFSSVEQAAIYDFLCAYKELFPDGNWKWDADGLELTIMFWEELVTRNNETDVSQDTV